MRLTKSLVHKILSMPDPWAVGNQVLYDLCQHHPKHTVDAEIIAKVWLIGRAYSASVERGRRSADGATASNEQFYTATLPKALRESSLDEDLACLVDAPPDWTPTTVTAVLNAHANLTRVFYNITKKNKRSLASKYLHFHSPELFFIFDSRAALSIRRLGLSPRKIRVPAKADSAYARFISDALGVIDHLTKVNTRRILPRDLDRLLLQGHDADSIG